MTSNIFKGRSLTVIDDFSLDERLYLFEKTRLLKEARRKKDKSFLDSLRINDLDVGLYEVFLEDSTRTKESFRNAAEFHRIKHVVMDASHSSFNKSESYADGFNTVIGYDNHIFVVRSKLEGVCKWLSIAGREYAQRHNLEFVPVFLNAGDGKHEHPTQELLDDFTFWEADNGDLSHIHIALVGDLLHGRTVHSKADGLQIYREVEVDVISHPELSMPKYYMDKMRRNGFQIREFSSIEEYLAQTHIASKWYFTRAQIERMGEDQKKRQVELRTPGTITVEQASRVPRGTVFYHPLPMHKEYPEIPLELLNTPLNGYEGESQNGYFVRITGVSAVAGIIGQDFEGNTVVPKTYDDDFIEKVPPDYDPKEELHEGIKPIKNGLVIDHICRGQTRESIYNHRIRVMRTMGFINSGNEYEGTSESRKEPGVYKGHISLPNHGPLGPVEIKKLAALAPGSTINMIVNGAVTEKMRLHMPPRIYNFKELGCINEDCISHPMHHEHVPPEFIRLDEDTFSCLYCETPASYKNIWQN